MKKSKFTETQIIAVLKQGDAGVPIKDLCRQAGISSATYYQWKSKYGGMEASELRRVKELEAENAKLKRMYAELALDNAAMKDLIAKKLQGRRRSATPCASSWRSTSGRCAGPVTWLGYPGRPGIGRRWIGRSGMPKSSRLWPSWSKTGRPEASG